MYWTDRYINRVLRAHKWHGANQTVMLFNLPQPMGLVAMHPARQPAGIIKQSFSLYTYLITFLSKRKPCLPLMATCLYHFISVRGKSLFKEPLLSYLPAFGCGTELLFVCLPLRLDTGSRLYHLLERYCMVPAKWSTTFIT